MIMMKTSIPIGDVFVKTKNIQNMVYLNKIWPPHIGQTYRTKFRIFKKLCEHFIYDFVLCPPSVQSTIRLYVAGASEHYNRYKV